ncbi:gp400 [Bacillus phage G]|uniref:Gp400 n=1 Tax=Bacillus phage G TaxID=2884420 RepID=G3MAE1_9CAUD|nr:gp400 [Bacillus phage G]AEO93659.1 gp400 [Bacillus phage G]
MIEIHMDNTEAKCYNLPQQIANSLAIKLSFKTGGFGVPTETKVMFDHVNHTTYTGLVPHVVKILHKLKLKYTIKDSRIQPESNATFNLLPPFELRDYQEEIVNRSTSRELIQAATGAGKTFIMYSLIRKYGVKPVVVIAPKVSLAEQIKDEFEKFSGHKIGIVGGGHYDIQDITICTPMSAPEELLKECKGIYYDECHNLPAANIFKTAVKAGNAFYKFGVSATPWRDGGDDLMIEAAISIRKPHLSINASKLIAKGKLTPCNIVFLPFKEVHEWGGSYHEIYKRAISHNENRNNMISKLAYNLTYKKGRTTLILVSKIAHGDTLVKKINLLQAPKKKTINGIEISEVEFLSGRDDTERRTLVLQSVRDGFTKILIGSTIADEGLDIPRLDALILAGSGKVSTRAFQRVGRVLRLYEGKKDALVFDILDETKTFKKHSLTRKALYETEPLWNIRVI